MATVTKFLIKDNPKAENLLAAKAKALRGILKFNPKKKAIIFDDSNQTTIDNEVITPLSKLGVTLSDTDPAIAAKNQQANDAKQKADIDVFLGQFPAMANVIKQIKLNDDGKKLIAKAMYDKLSDPSGTWLKAVQNANDNQEECQKIILKLIKSEPTLRKQIVEQKDTYSTTEGKPSINGKIKMPGMFEIEPDDSVWKDPFIVKMGCPMVNFSNPLIRKILSSEDAKEEFPKNYKAFKRALKKSPPAANGVSALQALGSYAGIFGKNPGVLLKEMVKSGNDAVPCHRNLMTVPYDVVAKADGSDDSNKITCKIIRKLGDGKIWGTIFNILSKGAAPAAIGVTYLLDPTKGIITGLTAAGIAAGAKELSTKYRGAKESGTVQMTPAALTTFYTAVNPNNVNAYMRAMNPEDYGASAGASAGDLLKAYVKYLNTKGHPPVILLKPSSKLNEEDKQMSESGRRGIVMVQAEFDGHTVGMFYNKKDAAKIFTEG